MNNIYVKLRLLKEALETVLEEEGKPVPKFKVGDGMRTKAEAEKGIIYGLPYVTKVEDGFYVCNNECIPIDRQDEYEYPPKFRSMDMDSNPPRIPVWKRLPMGDVSYTKDSVGIIEVQTGDTILPMTALHIGDYYIPLKELERLPKE